MGRENMKNPAVWLAAVIILTFYLVETTNCLQLRKTQRRVSQRETDFSPSGRVQEGKIVFGKVFAAADGNEKHSKSVSLDDDEDYQADFAGWSQQTDVDEAMKEKWNHLGTSLHCFGDHMKFRSLGPGASQLSVQQAHDLPMPLSMIPPRCGYRMNGNSRAFVMMAPYDGCNMIQQGRTYMLPLLWQGYPLSLLCPKRDRTKDPQMLPQVPQMPPQMLPQVPQMPPQMLPQVPQMPPQMLPQVPQMPPQMLPQVPQMPPQMLSQPYFDFYSNLFPALAEPVSQLPKFPFYPYPYPPQTTSPPPTTPVPKIQYPQIPYGYFPFPYWPQLPELPPFLPYPIEKHPQSPTSAPKTTVTPFTTTESPATTQAPPETPAQLYPMDFLPVAPNEHYPHLFYSHRD